MVADQSLSVVPSLSTPTGLLGQEQAPGRVEAVSRLLGRADTQGWCPALKCAEWEPKTGWMQCRRTFSSPLGWRLWSVLCPALPCPSVLCPAPRPLMPCPSHPPQLLCQQGRLQHLSGTWLVPAGRDQLLCV